MIEILARRLNDNALEWAKEVLRRERIKKVRKRISDLILYGRIDDIGEIPRFKIVQRRETFKKPTDCFMYALGIDDVNSGKTIAERFLLPLEQIPICEIKLGDYVAYYNKEGIAHVGTAVSSDRVVSKFGFLSHVFEHPIPFVPISYGNRIYAFRKPLPDNLKPAPTSQD